MKFFHSQSPDFLFEEMEFSPCKGIIPILFIVSAINLYLAVTITMVKNAEERRERALVETVSEFQCLKNARLEQADLDKLKDDIRDTLACYKNPGLAVSIVKDGQIVLSEGFGVTSPTRGKSVTGSTLFSMASLTKAFTAALFLDVLAKDGRFKLTSTVKEVLGDWFSFFDFQRTEYATLEDLLSHRLRVPSNDEIRFNPQINRQDVLKKVKFFESKTEFRVKGTYSSTNYVMLAAITELLGGNTWEQLMNQTIFTPLEMSSTSFAADVNYEDDNVAPPFATLNEQDEGIDPAFTKQWNSYCGSGCIFSSADNMAKWMIFHLSKGKDIHGHQVLPAALVQDLQSPRTLLPSLDLSLVQLPKFPVTGTGDLYGLGFRVGHYREYPIVTHTGSTPGYASMLTLVPSENIGVFVAMNGDDDNTYYRMALQDYIIDTILGFEPWLNVSTICSFPQPWQPRKATPLPVYDTSLKPLRPWTAYAGVYKNDGYGDLVVDFNSTLNCLTARFGFGFWQLHPQTTKDVFYAQGLEINSFYDVDFVTFKASNDGADIVSLIVKGFNRPLPPVFLRSTTDRVDVIIG